MSMVRCGSSVGVVQVARPLVIARVAGHVCFAWMTVSRCRQPATNKTGQASFLTMQGSPVVSNFRLYTHTPFDIGRVEPHLSFHSTLHSQSIQPLRISSMSSVLLAGQSRHTFPALVFMSSAVSPRFVVIWTKAFCRDPQFTGSFCFLQRAVP